LSSNDEMVVFLNGELFLKNALFIRRRKKSKRIRMNNGSVFASFEINDIPLFEYAPSQVKPMIISVGVASEEEIELAINACKKVGNNDITLLKCTSEYPSTSEQVNLRTIPYMKQRVIVKVGLSDHTMDSIVPIVAVSLGATVVEKHFILDRTMGGVDSAFSLEPKEFKEMVYEIRQTETALGNAKYDVSDSDKNRRRSLFVVKDITAGEILNAENIRSIRPGYGLHPKYYNDILGKTANKNIKKGTPLAWDLID